MEAAGSPVDGVLLNDPHLTLVLGNGPGRAGTEASLAFPAELSSAEVHRLVQQKRNIGGHTAQAEAWAELPADDQTDPSQLTQAGSDGVRYQKYGATT